MNKRQRKKLIKRIAFCMPMAMRLVERGIKLKDLYNQSTSNQKIFISGGKWMLYRDELSYIKPPSDPEEGYFDLYTFSNLRSKRPKGIIYKNAKPVSTKGKQVYDEVVINYLPKG